MFRLFGDSSNAPLSSAEAAAVQRLQESRGQLKLDGPFPDVKSEAGYSACAVFLSCADRAAQALGLKPAPRHHRARFTANYRALFPDANRHYRVDVLEASVDQQFDIWVNGEKFELDADAIEHAQRLQLVWGDFISALDRWAAPNNRLGRKDLVCAFNAFDVAWAEFEERYICALIAIEEHARQLVRSAVEHERQLQKVEARSASQRAEVERLFLGCIAKLNSTANYKGKGREDLGQEVVERARAIAQQCRHRRGSVARRGQEAALVLANDVDASYSALRAYIRKVGTCIEHVDPHLCNNVGLVARLVDYEETWTIAARYLCKTSTLDAVCDVFAEVRAAEKLAPELSAMIEDCDVELFMVLPRLVVLCYLADPEAARAELVRTLLPHRFGPAGGAQFADAQAGPERADPELQALHARYLDVMRQWGSGAAAPAPAAPCGRGAAWEGLVRQAVLGAEGAGARAPRAEVQRAIRELLLGIETCSMELQRHCPEDWNQCSAVLVHCLTGGGDPKAPVEFTV